MEKVISTPRRWYRIEYFECDDGLYKLSIYDNAGICIHPKWFKECDVKGSMAINLTWDDVQEFFRAIKNHDTKLGFKYHFCTLNGVYTVYVRERTNGTYELSISEKGIYINPKIFMDCKTRGLTAVNMTLDDVNEFCDAVRDPDLTNKKQYCLFNI
jgi:hypothetical protein